MSRSIEHSGAAEVERFQSSKRLEWALARLRQLPQAIDRFVERRVQDGRLSPETPLWWMLVRPGIMREHQAKLDENGKAELSRLRLSHVNDMFWILVFLGWVWVFYHRFGILDLCHRISFPLIDGSLYQSLLGHWELIAIVLLVYCFGARRVSEDTFEQMARVPGMMAVGIVLAVAMNGMGGVLSGIIPGSSTLVVVGIMTLTMLYSLVSRISEDDPEIFIPEGTGVFLGFLVGVGLNQAMYGTWVSIASGMTFLAAVGVGRRMADAIKAGHAWVGKLAAVAWCLSFTTMLGMLLREGGRILLRCL